MLGCAASSSLRRIVKDSLVRPMDLGRSFYHFRVPLPRRWFLYSFRCRLLTSLPKSKAKPPPPPSTKIDDKEDSRPILEQNWILPGLTLSILTSESSFFLASHVSSAFAFPVSGIPIAILMGMVIRNTVGYHTVFQHGISFSSKSILQAGIVCVAAKLSFMELLATGTSSIPVVLSSVTAGMLFIPAAGALAGLPQPMSLLLTAGTSICGVTAITALAPAIQAPNRDIAVAVANTVAFGNIGMLAYPYLFHALCSNSEQVGLCLGVAIHDTSQVLGSAISYKETFGDEVAFKIAAVTKLIRNLGLAVVIPLLTFQYHRSVEAKATQTPVKGSIPEQLSGLSTFTKYVPPFLVAFLAMSILRSTGDIFLADVDAFQLVMQYCGNDLSKSCLGVAMAAVGLSTDRASLRGVGWKPFAVGLSGALVVGGTGFTVAMLTA